MADVALNIITDALSDIKVLAESASATGPQGADGLRDLNQLLDLWNADDLTAFCDQTQQLTFPVTPQSGNPALGQPYVLTIGPTGDIVAARPEQIDDGWVLDQSSGVKVSGFRWLSKAEFDRFVLPTTQSAYPYAGWYNPTFPNGTISYYPVPQGAGGQYAAVVRYKQFLASFASEQTAVALPPGWQSALRYNLGPLMAPRYGKRAVDASAGLMCPWSITETMATVTLRMLKELNAKRYEQPLANDVPISTGRKYSWLTGGPV